MVSNVLAKLGRVSPAMVVAMLALFVALTGTAVATTSALIGGQQIRNNSVAGVDIRNNSLTGVDVRNKSLTFRDFRGSVRGPRGLRGLTGAAGPKGDKGDAGVPATRFFAWVDETGALKRGTPGAVSAKDALTGLYRVTFPGANLDACVPVAMPGTASNNGFFANTQITARIGSWPNVGESSDLVKVNPTTGSTGAAKDAAFQLAVFC